MKHAILYYSRSGNTRELAEQIYVTLPEEDKVIDDIQKSSAIPTADMYWIGFPVSNMNCPAEVMTLLEELENTRIALFATSGLAPVPNYKSLVEKRTMNWLSSSCEYLGMFMCQGKTENSQKELIAADFSNNSDNIMEMLNAGDTHPNDEDYDNLSEFCDKIAGVLNG